MSLSFPTPPKALRLLDACVESGFAPLDACLDVLDARRPPVGPQRSPVSEQRLPEWAWSDLFRSRAGTGWGAIEANLGVSMPFSTVKTRPWTLPPEVRFRESCTNHDHFEAVARRVMAGRQPGTWHTCVGNCVYARVDGSEYAALCLAHNLLRAERRCLAKDADRAFRKLWRVRIDGYDPASAFDWYVIQVGLLLQLGVAVASAEPLRFSRPVHVPGVTA